MRTSLNTELVSRNCTINIAMLEISSIFITGGKNPNPPKKLGLL
jgi:hypothetical protein